MSADEFGLLIRNVPCAGKKFRRCFKLIRSVQGKQVCSSSSLVVTWIKAKPVTIVIKKGNLRLIAVLQAKYKGVKLNLSLLLLYIRRTVSLMLMLLTFLSQMLQLTVRPSFVMVLCL